MSEQQSSAARVAGKSVRDFWYKGFRYWLTQPLTMGKYADEQTLVVYLRNNPGDFAAKMMQRLPEKVWQGVLNAAALAANGGVPTEEEWTNYGNSMWKKAYRLWTVLDPQHKVNDKGVPFTLIQGVEYALNMLYEAAQASEIVGRDLVSEVMMKCIIVSQEDALKNWSGQNAPEVDVLAKTPPAN